MPPIHFLIKPASGSCNMRCRYCFYADETVNRKEANYGMMKDETLEAIVQKGLARANGACTFAFQGGEPTLVGLPFYHTLIKLVKKYNTHDIKVGYAMQTNGVVLDDEWAAFFARHKFLLGLSLDGPADMHDGNRPLHNGKGSFTTVMKSAQLLERYKVDFNVLTVVTAQTARHIEKAYRFFGKNNLLYQQYIPCLDPLGEERGGQEYSLTPQKYAQFLKKLFDLWYADIEAGKNISIRYFDNLVGMLAGIPPESCGMLGHCVNQYVVEADGSVYPCDFYVLDEYRLGNLNTDSLEQIDKSRVAAQFIEVSKQVAPQCQGCQWQPICRGGCRRDRLVTSQGDLGLNYFCDSYKEFFSYAYPRLARLAQYVQRRG